MAPVVLAESENAETGVDCHRKATLPFPCSVSQTTGRHLHPKHLDFQASPRIQTWANYRDGKLLLVSWLRDQGRYRDSKRFRDRFRIQTSLLGGRSHRDRQTQGVSSRLLPRIPTLFFRLVHRLRIRYAVDLKCQTDCRLRPLVRDRYSPNRRNEDTRPEPWRRWMSKRIESTASGYQPKLLWPRCKLDLGIGAGVRGVCCRRHREKTVLV